MKIFVLVKEVPDTYGDRKLDLETGLADRGAGDVVLDEITERALEVALSYADANPGTEVVALVDGAGVGDRVDPPGARDRCRIRGARRRRGAARRGSGRHRGRARGGDPPRRARIWSSRATSPRTDPAA